VLRTALAAALVVGAAPAGLPAQAALSLRQALDEADRAAHPTRIAAGNAAAQRAQALTPLRGILPSVRLEGAVVRTTDPIGAFGTALRQRAITAADFDPQRLNHPNAISNHQGSIIVEQPLVALDAWTARRAALRAADASDATEAWTRLATRTDVIRAYYGAVLATERVRTLTSAVTAGQAHLRQAESLVRNGMATRSDALLAAVRTSELEAQLAEATGGASSAHRQLAAVLGRRDGVAISVRTALPPAARIREVVADDTADAGPGSRSDVDAAARALDAARADAARARMTLLPRINSFARYDWYSSARPYAGEKTWTVGVVASWSLFAGAGELADLRATSARAEAARAASDAVVVRARLEADDTRTALAVALVRLGIAERAVAQSAEAHRIVARKYAGGLATIVELLDAQAAETQTALALSQAQFAAIAGAAARRQATGADPAGIAALDASAVATADSTAR
jgi:outer membrane protein TolC